MRWYHKRALRGTGPRTTYLRALRGTGPRTTYSRDLRGTAPRTTDLRKVDPVPRDALVSREGFAGDRPPHYVFARVHPVCPRSAMACPSRCDGITRELCGGQAPALRTWGRFMRKRNGTIGCQQDESRFPVRWHPPVPNARSHKGNPRRGRRNSPPVSATSALHLS